MSNAEPPSEKIRFPCTGCGAKLAAPVKHVGATIRCPKCKTSLEIPAESVLDQVMQAAEARAEWSLARCPECEEVVKVRTANRGIPVSCPACSGEMIVAAS